MGNGPGRRRAWALIWLFGLSGLVACAVVESPPGGPVDTVPPTLVSFRPDSAAVVPGAVDRLDFTFSEKMNRVSAGSWLHLYPARKFRKTSWHGAIRAEVQLETPLPPDTVVVVEVTATMKDAHKVSGLIERRFPIVTGGSLPAGGITGSVVMADSALSGAVVELYAVPPDTLTWDDQPLLRRVRCDSTGSFRFDWLTVPGGPYLLNGFADPDRNARQGEKEAHRLFPDTVMITEETPLVELQPVELFPVDTPGDPRFLPRQVMPPSPQYLVFTQAITDADTGWTPVPTAYDSLVFSVLDSAVTDTVRGVEPGPNRVILFADLDRDSSFSVVAESLMVGLGDPGLYAVSDSLADTTGYALEPWLGMEPVRIEPGMLNTLKLSPDPFTIVPWAAPPPDTSSAADSASAVGDSIAAPADSVSAASDSTTVPDPVSEEPDDR